jgi:hypothetical protein
MTALEVFVAYAKLRDIVPNIHKVALDNAKHYYSFDDVLGQYRRISAPFKDVFYGHFNQNGLGGYMFYSILYQFQKGDVILNEPRVDKASKSWLRFVKNNVVLDSKIGPGTKIKYKFWGSEYIGVVNGIKYDLSRIEVRRNDDSRINYIRPGQIIEVDDKPFEFSFHIKWKGKEYAKKVTSNS